MLTGQYTLQGTRSKCAKLLHGLVKGYSIIILHGLVEGRGREHDAADPLNDAVGSVHIWLHNLGTRNAGPRCTAATTASSLAETTWSCIAGIKGVQPS
jgi:hypothetical protein